MSMENSINSWLVECAAREAGRKVVTRKEVYAEVTKRALKAGRDRIEISEIVQWSHGIAVLYRNMWTGQYHRARLDNVVMATEDRSCLTPAK